MSARTIRSNSSAASILSSSEYNSNHQLLTVPGKQHVSTPSSRRSSYSSTSSGHLSRHGGLRRRRLSQWKITMPLRDPKLKPIEKLKRFLKSLRIIIEVCLALKSYVNSKDTEEPLTLMEMQLNLQEDLNKKLPFNPHYYSASYVANKGSSKLKKLLAISPIARTKRHVKMIHTLVQNKKAFSKHPIHIRMKMCQVMIYQNYESRRIIIKQGHPPSAFYIILSGTCLINAKQDGNEDGGAVTNQTVNELKEGEVFGEVALLNHTSRTASVVCKDSVELLVIYKEDFDGIIRGPLYKQREEMVNYCRTVAILADWPVQHLSTASILNFHYQYFRKGTVVIKDNQTSEFLVIVKSGECRVVCTLVGDTEKPTIEYIKLRNKSVAGRGILPPLDHVTKQPTVKTRSFSFAFHHQHKQVLYRPPPTKPMLSYNRLPTISGADDVISETPSDSFKDVPWENMSMRSRKSRVSIFDRPGYMNRFGNAATYGSRDLQPLQENQFLSNPGKFENKRISIVHRTVRPSIIDDTPYTMTRDGKLKQEQNNKLGNSIKFNDSVLNLKQFHQKPEKKSKFAQIAVLKAGHVFGLEEMMKRTDLRLSLVSDGAECIFVSRKIFQKYADSRTIRCVNSMVGRYPTEEYIRQQLEEQSDWAEFRKEVVKDVLERREEKFEVASFVRAV